MNVLVRTRRICLQYRCCDLNQLIRSITLSIVKPRLVGRRLEVLEPRLDERDLLLVDRLDERGLLARLGQAVLVPVVDTVYGNRFGSATIAL